MIEERESQEAFVVENARCEAIVGNAIAKSLFDEFDYSLKLITGEVIRFNGASLTNDKWLHLRGAYLYAENDDKMFDRGIDIQIAHIVWAKDAPEGS